METEKDALRKKSVTDEKMENLLTSKESSKVKLKVVKKKIHMRPRKGLNHSNSSFNSSLNASTKMKQTLRSNNKALAHALQITKQDLALATNIICSLRVDNRNVMLEAANNKYVASQCVEKQVGARLKPVLMMFRQKVSDVGKHLAIVASTVQDISESISSYLSTSAPNSRSNSMEIGQNIEETPTEIPNEKVLLSKNIMGDVALKENVNSQICNDLSLIAESFINVDFASNTIDVLSKVDELESEKFCRKDKDQHLSVFNDEPRIATKSQPNVKRHSSTDVRRQSLDEIDFGTNLSTSRKKRRSSFLLPTAGLDKNLHQRLADTLGTSVIKGSCAEFHLENLTEKDSNILMNKNSSESSDSKVAKSNFDHAVPKMKVSNDEFISGADTSILSSKTAGAALVVDCTDNLLNNNSTINGEIDMELTEIINKSDIINISYQNIPTTNDPHSSDINIGKLNNVTIAKETFVKPAKVSKKVNTKYNKKSSKSSKDKKEDERVKCKETDGNENKTVIELRLPKPGKIVFSATRKNFSGIRPSPPKIRSKKKINEEKKEKEEIKSLFDFHDKTPQLLNKKDLKDEGIYNVSLNDSTFGKCQSLGQYRERVAMAKEKNEEITDFSCNSEKILDVNPTISRISNEGISQSKKTVTKDHSVDAKKKSRSRKKGNDGDGDFERLYNKSRMSTCETDVPERTLTRRTRSKVINYAEIDESFDTSVSKQIAGPEIAINCQKAKKLLGSDKIDGSWKQSENSKLTNKIILRQDSEMVVSSPGQAIKMNISKLPNSSSLSSKATKNELHTSDMETAQKHFKDNENIKKGIVSSLKHSSAVSDIIGCYKKALADDDISTNLPSRRRGRSSSQIYRVSWANSTMENAQICSSKLRSRSVSSINTFSNNSSTNYCNSVHKKLCSVEDKSSPIMPRNHEERGPVRTRKPKYEDTNELKYPLSSNTPELKQNELQSPEGKQNVRLKSSHNISSDVLPTKIIKERKQSRSCIEKIGELEQEISRKNVKSQSTKLYRDVLVRTEQENSEERSHSLINTGDILKIKKHVHSKVKGKATLISEMKENFDRQLADLTPEATSRNTSPLNLSKNSSKRLSEDNEETFGVKRPRRAAIKSISYREPSLNSKLRQGDELFVTKALGNGHFVCKDEIQKRNALENVTNMN